ncbi:hypothetical protein HBH56_134020 [Parastagonospora nodorum]|nr:hypothetical protein HBH56_134020 [Parastagonospora nodorum]KAH3926927.1 hypothetical protein HBH54_159280 [Parastagonospora nodorum]KAH3949476.1 hypothetical protein HBH53_089080 [Parastagonospora nodorum]KAH3958867.1 hypothetical protein HBH51_204240 [Parastagonospora nodorum]KAH3974709.1 hypothetical protein HBH52_132660 [Parastagonospora nodorum]
MNGELRNFAEGCSLGRFLGPCYYGLSLEDVADSGVLFDTPMSFRLGALHGATQLNFQGCFQACVPHKELLKPGNCIFDKSLWHDIASFRLETIDKVMLTTSKIDTITAIWRIQIKTIPESVPTLFPEAMRENFESQLC